MLLSIHMLVIPVVVTNQVRSQLHDEAYRYQFQGIIYKLSQDLVKHHVILHPTAVNNRSVTLEDPTAFDSHLVAALGIHWAHSVTVCLVLESRSGLLAYYFTLTNLMHAII